MTPRAAHCMASANGSWTASQLAFCVVAVSWRCCLVVVVVQAMKFLSMVQKYRLNIRLPEDDPPRGSSHGLSKRRSSRSSRRRRRQRRERETSAEADSPMASDNEAGEGHLDSQLSAGLDLPHLPRHVQQSSRSPGHVQRLSHTCLCMSTGARTQYSQGVMPFLDPFCIGTMLQQLPWGVAGCCGLLKCRVPAFVIMGCAVAPTALHHDSGHCTKPPSLIWLWWGMVIIGARSGSW